MTKQKNYALPIAMMFALFFMIAFVTNLQTPFAEVVKGQFSLSNFESLLGNAANFIAYAFMGIPAGLLLQKIGYKKTSLLAVLVGFVGVAITLSSGFVGSFVIYLAGAFISGFSMCMLNTVVNPMLNSLGADEKKGNQLLMFGGVFNSTGGTIAPIFAGILVGQIANAQISDVAPALYVAMAIFALAFVVLYFVQMPEPHIKTDAKKEKETHNALSFRHFNLGLIAIFIYVGVEVGIQAIAYLYMTAKEGGMGMSTSVAGTLIGTYWLLMLIGRLLGGIVAGKVSSKIMLATVTSIGAVLVLLAMFVPSEMVQFPAINAELSISMQEVPLNVVFLILCGLCTSVMWGSIFNLATSGLGKYTAMASGMFMVMVCGGGILPAFQGFIADKVGYMTSYWVIFAGIIYMLYFALVGSKNVNKDIQVD